MAGREPQGRQVAAMTCSREHRALLARPPHLPCGAWGTPPRIQSPHSLAASMRTTAATLLTRAVLVVVRWACLAGASQLLVGLVPLIVS